MRVISFKWKNFEPIIVFDDGRKLPLFDQYLHFKLGKRYCIGYYKNGKRHPCPENNEVRHGYQCELCKRLDENLPCVQCVGICRNPKRRPKCMKETYYLYLAVFGSMLKVGISIEHRIRQRLVEQGADFGVRLFTITDGALARIEEQKIRKYLNIVDRVNGNEKHRHLNGNDDESINIIKKAIELLKKKYNFSPTICDLRHYYRIKDIKTKFINLDEGTVIKGKVISVKGNLIVLENNNIGFNVHQLIGREIIPLNNSPI